MRRQTHAVDNAAVSFPLRQIRARYDEATITVYQAYPPEIAAPALTAGRFVPPFKRERMTWIKPSFCWMMYRCGWATKSGQERVLAVRITRSGFELALEHAALSHFQPDLHPDRRTWADQVKRSPVRVQWDPERDIHLAPLPYRSLQVGLSGPAVARYVDEWTVGIEDVTDLANRVRNLLRAGDRRPAQSLLPVETPYPLPPPIGARIAAS